MHDPPRGGCTVTAPHPPESLEDSRCCLPLSRARHPSGTRSTRRDRSSGPLRFLQPKEEATNARQEEARKSSEERNKDCGGYNGPVVTDRALSRKPPPLFKNRVGSREVVVRATTAMQSQPVLVPIAIWVFRPDTVLPVFYCPEVTTHWPPSRHPHTLPSVWVGQS